MSSEAEYTPGPWRSLYEEKFCVAAGERLIARLPHSISDEQEANAHLISAAPDLLEAAKGALARYPELNVLRVAIEKAEETHE